MTSRTRMWRVRNVAIHVINPVARLFAGWMPGFGLLTYQGRNTGRTYHLPVNVFRRGKQYIFVLTYGSESQWVKNVLTAKGCEMRVGGRDIRLVEPEVTVADWSLMPLPVRLIERRLSGVTEFLVMWER